MIDSNNLKKFKTSNPLKKFALKRFVASLKDSVEGFNLNHNSKIVDLGCGEGIVLQELFNSSFIDVTGVDISKKALKYASKLNPTVSFIQSDVVEFNEYSVDFVLCTEVLEHIKQFRKLLVQISCYSDNVIISVPNKWRFRFGNLIQLKHLSIGCNDPDHVSEWTKSSLKKLLEEHFFHVKIKPAGFFWLIAECKKRR